MTRTEIIQALDQEILKLHHAKQLLQGSQKLGSRINELVGKHSPTRPRTMSEEGRRRIAEAQKRRWAKQKGR
jgi:hypothetical protein